MARPGRSRAARFTRWGHRVSAREALLRASNYYRTADFYRREDPALDQESVRLQTASRRTFADAAALLGTPARALEIPFAGTTLPAYLFTVDGSGVPRPTVIYHGGYDSTLEGDYLALAAGALRRGYNVLAFDDPGQGATVRAGLHFRPDWEAVVTPVVDLAVTLPEVDTEKIALVDTGLGGYLAARAAAFEHRLAACVLRDGVWDMYETVAGVAAAAADAGGIEALVATSTSARWLVDNGRWTYGVATFGDLLEATRAYTLDGVADRITCPTLVIEAENDQFFRGQPQRVHDALTCPKGLVVFPEDEGGGEHCHEGATLRFHQVAFDWLDGVLGGRSPQRLEGEGLVIVEEPHRTLPGEQDGTVPSRSTVTDGTVRSIEPFSTCRSGSSGAWLCGCRRRAGEPVTCAAVVRAVALQPSRSPDAEARWSG
ncbi:alpha/beta hydrolase family protein [Pseudonocardia sp. HH130629-09]|uniref:alpha/beta hydrolase family protein n=1 Tax=Pseudonocardia sp. HH130629-09 TaxID=1641402 RepID=UPI001EE6E1E7|nr:alpha/beta hydrolase [Pseudonocardia sp. HH130629-09]